MLPIHPHLLEPGRLLVLLDDKHTLCDVVGSLTCPADIDDNRLTHVLPGKTLDGGRHGGADQRVGESSVQMALFVSDVHPVPHLNMYVVLYVLLATRLSFSPSGLRLEEGMASITPIT